MKKTYVWHQSWFKQTMQNCMESGRLELVGEMPRVETDVATIGSACHYAFEMDLDSINNGQGPLDAELMIQMADDYFVNVEQLPNFKYTKMNSARGAHNRIVRIVNHYIESVRDDVKGRQHLELKFGPLLLVEDDEREIFIEGIIDLADPLADFKTSGHKYNEREYQKWAVQPTFYTYARAVMLNRIEDPFPFEYFVIPRESEAEDPEFTEVQKFKVWRGPKEWNWLKERAIGLAKLIEKDLDEWPKNDDSWLCSKKWCAAYDKCAGKHLS